MDGGGGLAGGRGKWSGRREAAARFFLRGLQRLHRGLPAGQGRAFRLPSLPARTWYLHSTRVPWLDTLAPLPHCALIPVHTGQHFACPCATWYHVVHTPPTPHRMAWSVSSCPPPACRWPLGAHPCAHVGALRAAPVCRCGCERNGGEPTAGTWELGVIIVTMFSLCMLHIGASADLLAMRRTPPRGNALPALIVARHSPASYSDQGRGPVVF